MRWTEDIYTYIHLTKMFVKGIASPSGPRFNKGIKGVTEKPEIRRTE
jgi:hypothetical protein